MTRDDWILTGAGVLGLLAIGAIFLGKSSSLNPTVEPLYTGSTVESPGYMSYNAPKTYIPITSTAPCACGNQSTTLFGSANELASQVLSRANAVLANIGST